MLLRKLLLLSALVSISATSAYGAEMNAGIVHFTGEIIEPSCTIKGDTGTTNNVPLGTYPTSLFTQVSDESDLVPFSIELINCPVTSAGLPNIHLTFEGPTALTNSNNLLDVSSAAATAATNVGIAVSLKGSTTLLKMDGTDEKSIELGLPSLANDSIIADFNARYKAFAIPVTAGPADADMTVNILYR
ncbi:fimbrial protein [Buttiauxella selenatireducens]|uniref:Fimbrial protein n=1 Tax=Buttiauxella selenatireducens TaxID=3073902 RepID=A0ABY9SF95_9ENTR|nr:fimbrial protein [Buttiauxella sp. R73]WMY76171.1 fimbrial protein [Buttiauxella sp. R73]